jgi:hypothetical protein
MWLISIAFQVWDEGGGEELQTIWYKCGLRGDQLEGCVGPLGNSQGNQGGDQGTKTWGVYLIG